MLQLLTESLLIPHNTLAVNWFVKLLGVPNRQKFILKETFMYHSNAKLFQRSRSKNERAKKQREIRNL